MISSIQGLLCFLIDLTGILVRLCIV